MESIVRPLSANSTRFNYNGFPGASDNSIEIFHQTTKYGCIQCVQALHIAVWEGFFDIFNCLLRKDSNIPFSTDPSCHPSRKGANVNHLNRSGLAPINFAVLGANNFMTIFQYRSYIRFSQPIHFAFKSG
jgi:hypothetical protein